MTRHELINPAHLGAPKGYSNGVLAAPGRLLFVAGQIAWDANAEFQTEDFVGQFEVALANVVAVVQEAGGSAEDICRLTTYVVDKQEYLSRLREVGAAYRRVMGKHFPAMALVEVTALVEDAAKIEIEATAVIPQTSNERDNND